MLAFFEGIYLGLGLVMPLGPLNMYIFNHSSMQTKFRRALPVLTVASVCDLTLIVTAVYGTNFLAQIPLLKMLIMIVGAIFLYYMGIKTWRAKERTLVTNEGHVVSTKSQLLYTASLSLLNPHAILDTFIVIGAVSAGFVGFERHAFTCGCIVSDCSWFAFLALFGHFLSKLKASKKIFYFLDKFSAIIMLVIAFQLTVDLVQIVMN